jgi:hypothetical protein
MPKGNSNMIEDQTMDIGYFVAKQQRPHFFKK